MTTIGGSEAVNIFKVLDSIGDKDIKNAIDGLVKLNQGNLSSFIHICYDIQAN
ncbi:unnamed protein product [marine sediment metagenome]|uniref:Uncharacterized protein n=1 Tax=marine sediment metagenome TaxID=412755 RepID=X1SCW8_9ZZZZ